MPSVFKRGRRWYFKVKYLDGKWRARSSRAATRADALRLGVEQETRIERQRLGLEPKVGPATMSLWALCEWWIAHDCLTSSRNQWRQRLWKHVGRSTVGAMPVAEITPEILGDLFDEMGRAGGLAPSTINKMRQQLSSIFKRAYDLRKIGPLNPVRATRRAPQRRSRVYSTLLPGEVERLLAAVPEPWRCEFAVAVYAGLRKGEILGLHREDVDLERKLIVVRRSYDRDETKGRSEEPVPIASGLEPYLRIALGRAPRIECPALLFPGTRGPRTREADPQLVLRRALARAGIVRGYDHVCRRCKHRSASPNVWHYADQGERRCPRCDMRLWAKPVPRAMRFHDLRHSTATLLLSRGVAPQVVQRIMRHASIKTTVDTYGHLAIEDLRPAVELLSPAGGRGA